MDVVKFDKLSSCVVDDLLDLNMDRNFIVDKNSVLVEIVSNGFNFKVFECKEL